MTAFGIQLLQELAFLQILVMTQAQITLLRGAVYPKPYTYIHDIHILQSNLALVSTVKYKSRKS